MRARSVDNYLYRRAPTQYNIIIFARKPFASRTVSNREKVGNLLPDRPVKSRGTRSRIISDKPATSKLSGEFPFFFYLFPYT